MLKEFDISGRIALVTGAGRGIGAGIVEVLAEAGASVVVNALTDRYAGPLAERITRGTGNTVVPMPGDVTDPAQVDDIVDRAVTELGDIDILVNGLGDAIPGPIANLPTPDGGRLSDDQIREVLDINLMSTVYCTRAVGERFLARGRGKVINISGFAGVRGRAGQSVYAAAKTGLVGLTRTLALEWAPYGVQVNAIAPGQFPDVVTSGQERYQALVRSAKDNIPSGRVGEPREVGFLALYLASPASDYMTGQVLCIDGGMTA